VRPEKGGETKRTIVGSECEEMENISKGRGGYFFLRRRHRNGKKPGAMVRRDRVRKWGGKKEETEVVSFIMEGAGGKGGRSIMLGGPRRGEERKRWNRESGEAIFGTV